jgi:hypothetical protein
MKKPKSQQPPKPVPAPLPPSPLVFSSAHDPEATKDVQTFTSAHAPRKP